MPVTTALGRVRQEARHEFAARLGYTVSSRPDWQYEILFPKFKTGPVKWLSGKKKKNKKTCCQA